MKDPRDVIVAPVVSEKSYDLIEKANTYTFEVDRRSFREHTEPDRQVEAHRTHLGAPGRIQARPRHPGSG